MITIYIFIFSKKPRGFHKIFFILYYDIKRRVNIKGAEPATCNYDRNICIQAKTTIVARENKKYEPSLLRILKNMSK